MAHGAEGDHETPAQVGVARPHDKFRRQSSVLRCDVAATTIHLVRRLPQSHRVPLPNTPLRTVGKSRDGRHRGSRIHGTGLPILPSRGKSRGGGLDFLSSPPTTITEQVWRMSDGPPPDGYDRPPTQAGEHPGLQGVRAGLLIQVDTGTST